VSLLPSPLFGAWDSIESGTPSLSESKLVTLEEDETVLEICEEKELLELLLCEDETKLELLDNCEEESTIELLEIELEAEDSDEELDMDWLELEDVLLQSGTNGITIVHESIELCEVEEDWDESVELLDNWDDSLLNIDDEIEFKLEELLKLDEVDVVQFGIVWAEALMAPKLKKTDDELSLTKFGSPQTSASKLISLVLPKRSVLVPVILIGPLGNGLGKLAPISTVLPVLTSHNPENVLPYDVVMV
jgi:hypothetical protein